MPFLSTRAHAFAVMLATYLAGLAIGSLLFARGRGGPREAVAHVRAAARRSGGERRGHGARPRARGCRRPRLSRARGRCARRGGDVEVVARFVVATVGRRAASDDLPRRRLPRRRAAGRGRRPRRPRRRHGGRLQHRGRDRGLAPHRIRPRAAARARPLDRCPRRGRSRGRARSPSRRAAAGGAGSRSARARWCSPSPSWPRCTPRDRLATLWADQPRRPPALLRRGCPRHGGRPRAIDGRGPPSAGCTSRASRTPATPPPRCATCACRRCCHSSIHRGEPRSALVVGFGTGITAGALLADA